MDDKYYLRKANIDELDLSKYEKDYSPEELAAVKQALSSEQKRHQEAFDKLPFTERAKYHAADAISYAEQNPETVLAVPAAVSLLTAGNAAVNKGADVANKIHNSLRDLVKSKFGDDGLLANQKAEKAAAQAESAAQPVNAATVANDAAHFQNFESRIKHYESQGMSYADALDKTLADQSAGTLSNAHPSPAGTPKEVSSQATPTTNVDVNAEVGKRPSEMPMVEKSETTTGRKAVAKDVAAAEKAMAAGVSEGLPPTTLKTGTGKPAYEGQADTTKFKSSYAKPADIPKGYAFVPGAQYIDPVRGNVGQETFTKEFTNRPYPQTYKGSPDSAIELSNEINRSLDRPTRAQLIAEGKPLPKNTPGITKEISKSKKVTLAGVTGALVAIPDLVLAAQEGSQAAKQGDTQMARGYVTDLIGALTGPLGMIASQTFGTSPEDLRVLRAAEQGRKVGGGRGIAPPSAYQR